jgi:hypothetical protein
MARPKRETDPAECYRRLCGSVEAFPLSKGLMRTDIAEKVLEKLATSDKITIVIERQSDGKKRVTSGSWDGEKVILRDQVLEVRQCRGAAARRAKASHHRQGEPAD